MGQTEEDDVGVGESAVGEIIEKLEKAGVVGG